MKVIDIESAYAWLSLKLGSNRFMPRNPRRRTEAHKVFVLCTFIEVTYNPLLDFIEAASKEDCPDYVLDFLHAVECLSEEE